MCSEDDVIPFLLSGYVCQLDDVLRQLGTEGQSVEKNEETGMDSKLKKVLDMLPALCQGCLKCLRQSRVRKLGSDQSNMCVFVINYSNCAISHYCIVLYCI